ncbi:MAG: hypothetical protein SXA11_26540 [Cyanobacteriota bacterium]|nr:hypothetical protein [Cyanobacteriota bacterium]
MELPAINLSEPMESALLSYRSDRQDSSIGAIVQEALEEFLTQRGYLQRPATKKPLRIVPASKGSGYADTSVNHDLAIVESNREEKLQ